MLLLIPLHSHFLVLYQGFPQRGGLGVRPGIPCHALHLLMFQSMMLPFTTTLAMLLCSYTFMHMLNNLFCVSVDFEIPLLSGLYRYH